MQHTRLVSTLLRSVAPPSATPSALRSFSSSAPASSKLSPLHKTTLDRAKRAARGTTGQKGKGKERMTLEEAAKVLQVRFLSLLPSLSFQTTKLTKSRAGLVSNNPKWCLRDQHSNKTRRHNPTQRSSRACLPSALVRLVNEILPPSGFRLRSSCNRSSCCRS